MTIMGTSGDDGLTGTEGHDDFDVTQGGVDIVRGLDGNDTFNFGGTYTFGDQVRGGGGDDTLILTGQESPGITLSSNINSIEQITLAGNFNFVITAFDGALDPGKTMVVAADLLVFGGNLAFDGSSETFGNYVLIGSAADDNLATGAGDDRLEGRDGNDTLVLRNGTDRVDGGIGNDIVHVFGPGGFDKSDRIDGGDGFDTLRLQGDYSNDLTVKPNMMPNIEVLKLGVSFDYTLDLSRLAPNDGPITIDGSELGENDVLTAYAASAGVFGFTMIGGAGADILEGGTHNDVFFGGAGADLLRGKDGADAFDYPTVSDSTSGNFDVIFTFDTQADVISPEFNSGVTVNAIDAAVKNGVLSLPTFDADLEAAIGEAELGAGNAVLFRPKHGMLAQLVFLIVDGNGEAGYQGGEDLVVRLGDATHLAHLSPSNFSVAG